jgi:hypothetical protein
LYLDDVPLGAIGAPPPTVAAGKPVREAPAGLWFGIRAWWAGDKARVMVYALLDDPRAPSGKTQTPIAIRDIAPGQSTEISETEKWGASRVFIKAVAR